MAQEPDPSHPVQAKSPKTLPRTSPRQMFEVLKGLCCVPIGFFQYHCLPRKKIVLLLSPMRAGSTLLKALLGEASDISHIPEVHFLENKRLARMPLFFYAFYALSYFAAKERIVLLKKPMWLFDNGLKYPSAPATLDLVAILLVRDPRDITASLLELPTLKPPPTEEEIRLYIYRSLRALALLQTHPRWETIVVCYEDLVSDPKEITGRILRAIGSVEPQGFDRYSTISRRWQWGNDDASEAILSGEVQTSKNRQKTWAADELLQAARSAQNSDEFFDFLLKVG